jgi:GDPmannose 4,6-dehydratase
LEHAQIETMAAAWLQSHTKDLGKETMSGTALITGVTGQDGSYLAELLLGKGYTVHGIIRRASTFNTERIDHIYQDVHETGARLLLHYGELTDASTLRRVLDEADPDEIYHLGAQSHVGVSFREPLYTCDVDALGTLRLLEAVRDLHTRRGKKPRVYNACSSEMFGSSPPRQSEDTPFHPRSPYGVAKVASYWLARNYREAYGIFISNGILFNHESPRRGETFVTRKVTRAAGRIRLGLQRALYLGNLDARRDWGFAGDYVEAMWMMLQDKDPSDLVVATGESYSVRDLLDEAFGYVDLDWHEFVKMDTRYLRPTEVDHLEGDARRARARLGWEPRVGFRQLVRMMVDADTELAQREHTLLAAGHTVESRRSADR